MNTTGTFFGTYDKRLKEWEDKIKVESDPKKRYKLESEMYNYMAECLPYLSEYMKDAENDKIVEGPFDIKIKKGVKRQELYYDYLKDVEGYKGPIPSKQINADKNPIKCSNESCKSSDVFIDSRSSNYVCRDCGACEY